MVEGQFKLASGSTVMILPHRRYFHVNPCVVFLYSSSTISSARRLVKHHKDPDLGVEMTNAERIVKKLN